MARAASLLAAGTVLGAVAAAGSLMPAAGAASASTGAVCTFNGVAAPGPLTNVTPGETIDISCSGLPWLTWVSSQEASPLGGISPSPALEADVFGVAFASTGFTGTVSQTVTVPSPFKALDSHASCPPTQAQIDAGLAECTLVVADTYNQQALSSISLLYKGQGTPAAPSLAVSPGSVAPGGTVSVSDGTSPSGYFWGNAAAVTTIPASDITVGGVTASSSSLSVSKASYDPTTGVITPPSISGSFTVAKTAAPGSDTVGVAEPSTLTGFAGPVRGSAPLDVIGGVTPLPLGAVGGLALAVLLGGGVVYMERRRRRVVRAS